ncbi:DUF3526 domain-containing protein [Tenacibaculum sp. SSH1-16]|uniref:DUF3526 domain-containing protein n=1 Tax=Tenacibaculum TaxID=104267 RepID=UPI0032C43C5D
MFFQTINYELKILFRNGWITLLTVILLSIIGFATYNGQKKVKQRTDDIIKVKQNLVESDTKMLKNILDIENGIDTGLPYWMLPNNPSTVGTRHPRVVAMDAQPLSFIATGQSDLYTHFMKPSIFGNNFALDYTEIANPVQLLFGTFDISFVFIFILPLLIIAFTYNILSREKELGTLRLIGSQPLTIRKWLIQKLGFRFILFASISLVVFLVCILIFTKNALLNFSQLFATIMLLIAYEAFWFSLAGIVNLKINNSSKNALSLIGLWLLIVLVIPATANQISTSIYPTPSRLNMINEIREANREIEKKQDEILDGYLRDHPELANKENKNFTFWHRYFASQDLLEQQLSPLLLNYNKALKKQQQVVDYFKYTSPAILMQEALNKIAGTSANDYENYKQQVVSFSNKWRDHIVPLLFKNKKYTIETYESRPTFIFKPLEQKTTKNLIAILMLTSVVILTGFLIKKKTSYFS